MHADPDTHAPAAAGRIRYVLDVGWQALFKDLDIAVQDVLRHAHLPLDLLARKPPTVNAAEYFKLWESLAQVAQDETFPLRMAQAMSPETFSPPLFACFCSADLNMALERLAKYKPLVGPLRLDLQRGDRHTRVAFGGLPENGPVPGPLIAFEQVFWVYIARLATREPLRPQAVHVTFPLPGLTAYEDFYGVRVTRDSFNGLTFSAEDARKPFLTASEAVWEIFEPALRQRMENLTRESPFRDRVRACLIEILASGHYSMADVASRLAMSSRTLQRRLRAEDTSFQQVLDDLREELARHYLSTSDYSSGQIAFLLGYEEPNSFFRAFRAWTGQTPEFVRAEYQRSPI